MRYVQFNCFIELTINSHTDLYKFGFEEAVVSLSFNLHTRQNCANFLISLCTFLNFSLKQQDDNSLNSELSDLSRIV